MFQANLFAAYSNGNPGIGKRPYGPQVPSMIDLRIAKKRDPDRFPRLK